MSFTLLRLKLFSCEILAISLYSVLCVRFFKNFIWLVTVSCIQQILLVKKYCVACPLSGINCDKVVYIFEHVKSYQHKRNEHGTPLG